MQSPEIGGSLNCHSVVLSEAAHKMTAEESTSIVGSQPKLSSPAEIDQEVNKWHFIK